MPDGQIAVNPKTGERLQLVNGKWSPMAQAGYQTKYPQAEQQAAANPPDARASLASRVREMQSSPTLQPGQQEADYARAYAGERKPGKMVMTDADVASMGLGGVGTAGGVARYGVKGGLARAAGAAAGGFAGATGGAYGGEKLGAIPGKLADDPDLQKRGAAVGEAIGAVGGGLVGAMGGGAMAGSGRVPLKMRVAGVPIEGEIPMSTAGGPASEATSTLRGTVVTPGQQAEDVGRFYAGAGGGGPNPYVTEENQRLLQKLGRSPTGAGGETELDRLARSPGENPNVKSLRRKVASEGRKPWNQ